jgi:Holliday junction resolvasome RuvABC endonuclease subunit
MPEHMHAPDQTIAMGLDCGIAATGLAIVRGPVESPTMLYGQTIVTRPMTLSMERKSFDDTRRLGAIAKTIEVIVKEFCPHAAGLEFYMPYPGRGRASWKVGMCYGLALGLCQALNVPVYAQLPIDVKYGVAGVKTAGKADIIARILHAMPSMKTFLNQTTPARREHIADAAGHALLAMRSRLMGTEPHL